MSQRTVHSTQEPANAERNKNRRVRLGFDRVAQSTFKRRSCSSGGGHGVVCDLRRTVALQSQLEGTENRIAVARRDYIDAVRAYNTEIRTFPSIIWAKTVFGSKPLAEFAANESAQTPPQVKF
jgi:LemA family